jgi:hypothetical protein
VQSPELKKKKKKNSTIPQKEKSCQVTVAHTYNPSYSGGRGKEDDGLKFIRPYLSQKNPSQKSAGGVAQGVGPEFKPQ